MLYFGSATVIRKIRYDSVTENEDEEETEEQTEVSADDSTEIDDKTD
jgi:hypothetical protein